MARYRRPKTRIITKKDITPTDDDQLESLYIWVDEIPLSRPKRNLQRDFADGVMIAELVHHFVPGIVEKHNYQPANSTKGKKENWLLFERKVMSQLGVELTDDVVNRVTNAQPWAIERILIVLREKIDLYLSDQRNRLQPEADQNRGGRPTGYEPSSFHKATSLQNLSRTRRKDTEEVPIEQLIEKEELISQQTSTIQMLTEKIQKLEHLCQLKDKRIEDMSDKLLQLQSVARQPKGQNRTGAKQQQGGGYHRQQVQPRWN